MNVVPKTAPPAAFSARALAATVLDLVERRGRYASDELNRVAEQLGGSQRALLTTLVYGVLQNQALLDWWLNAAIPKGIASTDPRIRQILRVALFQLRMMDNMASHTVLNAAATHAKKIAGPRVTGFVNAVLRRLEREPSPDPGDLAIRTSHPQWIVDSLAGRLPPEELPAALDANNMVPPLVIRPLRGTRDSLAERFERFRIGATSTRYAAAGLVLSWAAGNSPFSVDREQLGQGWIVQDEAAQLVAELCDPQPGERLLEIGCGGGGKTTHLAELAADRCQIIAIDRHRGRLERLRKLIAAELFSSIEVRETDALSGELAGWGKFDKVVIDAPCSGLGVLRRQPEIRWRRTRDDVSRLAETQRALLDQADLVLAAEGTIVYAVCTHAVEEGSELIAGWCQSKGYRTERPQGLPAALLDGDALVTWPHRHQCDGFFVVKLVRN